MNTLKKLITLLALLLPAIAVAEGVYDFEVNGIYYKIVNNEAYVTYQNVTYVYHDPDIYTSDYTGDVVIPSSVTYNGQTYTVTGINSHAFEGCWTLTGVTIPNTVTTISFDAFKNCSGLTNIEIPSSVTTVYSDAFLGCTGLTRVDITDLVAWCNINYGSIGANPLALAHHLYLNGSEVTDLTIPDGVTTISQSAFYGCTSLRTVEIPNFVTTIGRYAFFECTGLTRATIGNAVTTIDEAAFYGCSELISVSLGNSVETFGTNAFGGCTHLTQVRIPDSMTAISTGAFRDCTGLTGVTIGKSVTTIGTGSFMGCTALTSIDIPNSVTEIGLRAFYNCANLSTVTIGNSIATIGKEAFINDPSIEIVTCKATTPPSWSDASMFTTNVYNHAPLHVPTDAERAYKTNQYWGQFLTIIGDVTNDNPSGDEDGYEYVPFVREGVKWVYSIQDYRYEADYETNPARGDNKVYRIFEMKGDTIINGKTYKAVHKYTDDVYSEPSDVIPVYLREENKMVYGIIPDGLFYDDALVGNYNDFTESIGNGQEFLLYDFQDPVSYWESMGDEWHTTHLHMDTVVVGGHLAKRYFEENEYGDLVDYFRIIEGIGAMGMNSYPLAFFMPACTGIHCTAYYNLEKVVENDEVIYPQNYVEDRYLPVIREGMTWVNVHVVINDGDTTYNYYTYEFKGNYPERDSYDRVFKAVYSQNYTNNGVSDGDERLVAGLREDEACILCFKNEPLNGVDNLINFYSYYGNNDVRLLHENLEEMWDIDYYIDNQTDPNKNFLNTDNFVKADPIMIDGYQCSRLAYLNEQGDTVAYVVEGIGFDSRDMGDLLTPFTRRPDPNADYQEWCGLSHVIKDGKIIYKGMRYRPYVPGDVNGDGETTVADANSVIDVVIMGGNAGHTRIPAADVNGDGEVNIADVNAIIDMILSQQFE